MNRTPGKISIFSSMHGNYTENSEIQRFVLRHMASIKIVHRLDGVVKTLFLTKRREA
jgi:hypothetical protein